ncbi:lysophospholipase L1-like esterase [Alkalibaculum bacchi]|uniref:Lysophospholipase L1-like esterase n=1 Tax=Alkalibaculum bacchi TaxID=645887 RepID=A0A366I9E5_9FIRM|nr:SGNH/GDSL hydrolase family protein [Alkalibaculum bacchi]RBP65335.1 lysophospholipase L1-like esterase [Alkalibaculum bacchi]
MSNKIKKRILCYGDSNTFGFVPLTGRRYTKKERWTGVLQQLLGSDYKIIEEGLCGRTTVFDDPFDSNRNGRKMIIPCIETHQPLDLIIIMLGSNDLKKEFNAEPSDIARGVRELAKMAIEWLRENSNANACTKILLVSPIHIGKAIETSLFGEEFEYVESYEKCLQLASQFQMIAEELGVEFMDAALAAKPSEEDGLHLTKEEHRNLADAFAKRVKEIVE